MTETEQIWQVLRYRDAAVVGPIAPPPAGRIAADDEPPCVGCQSRLGGRHVRVAAESSGKATTVDPRAACIGA